METICISPRGFEQVLIAELGERLKEQRDRLFLVRDNRPVYFTQNIWLKPTIRKFDSISQAAKILKDIQRNWFLYSTGHHRRAALIQEQLPPIKLKRIEPYSQVPAAPLGSWTLWDEGTLLYSAECSSPFPNGEIEFMEDKDNPPSRAYLKLWEYFLLASRWPKKGDRVIDLGSSPGGWTWALDQLGCAVISVDKSPLAADLRLSSRVKFISESAFALKPKDVGPVEWLFSDIICYPDRLFELVDAWRTSGLAKNFVCTIKFQGETDFPTLKKFLDIPGAKTQHLYHNKHELTFSLLS